MDAKLVSWLAAVTKDPYAFVMGAFPWGEANTIIEGFAGPDEWQKGILDDIGAGLLTIDEAIKLAVASGHGIGKTALISWIVLWGFTTCVDTRGRVTAGTEAQLRTITWAELGKWFNLFIGKEYFKLTATALISVDPARERTWRIDMVPWSSTNPQAFAGMHNQGRRIIYIFDEGSAIDDIIYETAEGALTDANTQIIWVVFGNPTKNSGRFKEIFPGEKYHAGWKCRQIDSREVKITNKKDIAEKIATYGEDSDYIRIRVKGQFPRYGMMEFYSSEKIDAAMKREAYAHRTDPLALGVDVARYGANNTVLFPRKGRDARSIPFRVFSGLSTVAVASKVFEFNSQHRASGIFIDGGGVGGGAVDNVRNLRLACFDVNFGSGDDVGGAPWGIQGEKYANKRAAMYGASRAWLDNGCLPDSPELKRAMLAIKYTFNKKDEIILVSKEDIVKDNPDISLDELDALICTFAYPLAPDQDAGGDYPPKTLHDTGDYDPYATDRIVGAAA